jgi:hypothetical protein
MLGCVYAWFKGGTVTNKPSSNASRVSFVVAWRFIQRDVGIDDYRISILSPSATIQTKGFYTNFGRAPRMPGDQAADCEENYHITAAEAAPVTSGPSALFRPRTPKRAFGVHSAETSAQRKDG